SVTPPPEVPGGGAVLCPREPLRIPACSNSKKSGSRAAAATSSKRKIRLAGVVPLGLVYVHALPAVPPTGKVSPKHVLTLAAVPALIVERLTPAAVKAVITGSLLFAAYTTALGPLYVMKANRLSGKRVLTSGSPTAAVVPSNRVKLVVT